MYSSSTRPTTIVFQPLLYQVATSILAPEHIGAPIRHVLRPAGNGTTVIQGTVYGSGRYEKGVPRGRGSAPLALRLPRTGDRGSAQLLRSRRVRSVRLRPENPSTTPFNSATKILGAVPRPASGPSPPMTIPNC